MYLFISRLKPRPLRYRQIRTTLRLPADMSVVLAFTASANCRSSNPVENRMCKGIAPLSYMRFRLRFGVQSIALLTDTGVRSAHRATNRHTLCIGLFLGIRLTDTHASEAWAVSDSKA